MGMHLSFITFIWLVSAGLAYSSSEHSETNLVLLQRSR
jgi:hypothetical protein